MDTTYADVLIITITEGDGKGRKHCDGLGYAPSRLKMRLGQSGAAGNIKILFRSLPFDRFSPGARAVLIYELFEAKDTGMWTHSLPGKQASVPLQVINRDCIIRYCYQQQRRKAIVSNLYSMAESTMEKNNHAFCVTQVRLYQLNIFGCSNKTHKLLFESIQCVVSK